MKLFLLLAITAVAAHAASPADDSYEDYSASLEVKRPAKSLSGEYSETKVRKSGFVYVDKMKTSSTFLVDVGPGKKIHVSTTMHIENVMTVTDVPGGGQQIIVQNTRASIDIEGIGAPVHCELGQDEAGLKAACAPHIPLLQVANTTDTVVIDDQGNVVEESSSRNGLAASVDTNSNNNNNKPATEGATKAASKGLHDQLTHSSKLMKMIPVHPVQPGDSWPVEEEFADNLESLEGTSKMLGYKKYKGSDCAVIFVTGVLHMELKAMLEKMGLPDDGAMDKLDAKISQVMYWDYQTGLSRWSETNTSMTLEKKNPYGSITHIPFNETIQVFTDIKEKISSGPGARSSGVRFSLWFVFMTGLVSVAALFVKRKYGEAWKPVPQNNADGQELVPMAITQATLL